MPVRIYEPEDASGTVAYLHGGGWVLGHAGFRRRGLPRARERVGRAGGQHRLPARARAPVPGGAEDALSATRALQPTSSPATAPGRTWPRSSPATCANRSSSSCSIYPVTDAGVNTPSYGEFGERYGLTAAVDAALLGPLSQRRRRPRRRRLAAARDGPRGRPARLHPHRQPRRPARRGRGLRARARTLWRARHARAPRGRDPWLLALADDRDRPRRGPAGGRRDPRMR